MYTENQDLLQLQTNAEEYNSNNSQSSEIYIRESIPKTPFTLIKDKEKHEKHITLGNYRINKEPIPENENIEEYMLHNIFDIMMSISIITYLQINKN